ncbi:MAG: signal peptidase I [Pirellulales bacterium]|nr:signal peptidase I [Pirellulales bacterium]
MPRRSLYSRVRKKFPAAPKNRSSPKIRETGNFSKVELYKEAGGTRFIGRVVAVAGDHLEIRGERLLINGKGLQRDRVPDESLKLLGKQVRGRIAYEVNSGHRYLVAYGDSSDSGRARDDFEATIPERHVFVLGDNRDRSKDSRHFGSIPSGEIVGYVDYVFWPSESWSRFGVVNDRLPSGTVNQ